MSQFRVTVTTEYVVEADNQAQVRHIISNMLMPLNSTYMHPPHIEALEEILPADLRLLTQVPNVPQDQLISLVTNMSDIERIIIAMCASPTPSHDLYSAIRFKYPEIELFSIARAIAKLKNEGWLNVMKYHIERQLFTKLDATALSTAHNATIKKYAR